MIPRFRFQEFTCPFCFERSALSAVKFRCHSDPVRCNSEGKSFEAPAAGANPMSWIRPNRVTCPYSCGQKTASRYCPVCNAQLPHYTGDVEELIFGIVGAKVAGKSNYVGVLIREIENKLATALGGALKPVGDNTKDRYARYFEQYLFGHPPMVVPATRAAAADDSVQRPLCYDLRVKRRTIAGLRFSPWLMRLLDMGCPFRDITLSFFDTAGEDLTAEDVMRAEYRFIYNSQGLVLLLDPLQIPAVRDALGLGPPGPEYQGLPSADDILHRVINLIQQQRDIGHGRLIETPIALAFSKCDEVDELFPPGHPARPIGSARIESVFDWDRYREQRKETLNLLLKWGCESLLNTLQSNFYHFGCFFLSSLGHRPSADGSIDRQRFVPRRILDPFQWLLASNGVIPTKGRRYAKHNHK